MNLYAIRDRLLDYWMTPFAAPDDKAVLSSLSYQLNLESSSAISQAPHHYEIHRIAKVTENSHVIEDREFLCDCASLIRAGVRKEPQPGAAEDNRNLQANRKHPPELARAARAYKQAPKGQEPPEEEPTDSLPRSPGGTC